MALLVSTCEQTVLAAVPVVLAVVLLVGIRPEKAMAAAAQAAAEPARVNKVRVLLEQQWSVVEGVLKTTFNNAVSTPLSEARGAVCITLSKLRGECVSSAQQLSVTVTAAVISYLATLQSWYQRAGVPRLVDGVGAGWASLLQGWSTPLEGYAGGIEPGTLLGDLVARVQR